MKSTRVLAGISVLLVLLLSVSGCGSAGTALATAPQSTAIGDIKATPQSATTVTLSSLSLFFGTQLLAIPSPASAVTLTNSGTSALTINSIVVAGANSADFGVSHNCPISPNTLAASSGCTLQISFTPQTAGPRKSSISISDSSGSGAQTIIVTGVGTAISAAPSGLNFNSQQVGTSSNALPVVITNAGSTAVHLWQIAFVGANTGDFSQSNTSTCGTSLGAGANCTVDVVFTPAAAGSRTASLMISNDGGGSPQAVLLAGTASNPMPPGIGSLLPSAMTAGSGAFTLTVYGTNFVQASTVQWNGNSRQTTYVSPTQLTAQISAADIATIGTSTVTVANPLSNGGASGGVGFTINAQVSCPNSASAGLSVCISNLNRVPRLIINGVPTPPLMFFGNIEMPQSQFPLLTQEINLASASGIHLYKFTTNVPWTGSNYTWDDAYIDFYLAADPNAMILLEINMEVVDELGTFSVPAGNDNVYQDGTTAPISMASDFYFNAYETAIISAINHYESSKYADRIFGYWIGAGSSGSEWFLLNYREKGLDYSPVNLTAFRQWLTNKYGTDAALSTAWGQSVTLATAAIPVPATGRFPIAGASQGQAINAFYTPTAQQNWVDYSAYVSQLTSNRVLTLAHAAKQTTNGGKLVGTYFGYMFDLPGSMSGHLNGTSLLDSPDIDMLGSPISYNNPTDRLAGGPSGFMSAVDSVALHGKLWINEDDLDTWLAASSGLPAPNYNGWVPTQGFTDTNNVLQRNLANALVHRAGTYWMDVNTDGAFNDSRLWLIMSQYGLPLFNDLYNNPTAFTPDVAVLVDETSVLCQQSDWDFLYSARALLRNNIVKSGARIGFYYLADFLDGTLPPVKVYVFVNAGYLTDTQVRQIQTRLANEHATAIWQHAPGFLGGSTAGAARTSTLTGITVTQADGYPGTSGVGELVSLSWGFGAGGQNTLSPRLVVTDTQVTSLGQWSQDQKVNSARKSTGGFTSVLLGDFTLGNPDLWRTLFTDAAVHVWDSADDVLLCDSRTLLVHATSTGTRTIELPAPLVDVNTGLSTFSVNMQLGDTLWFNLK